MSSLSPEFRWIVQSAPPAQKARRQAAVDRLQALGIYSSAGMGEAIARLCGDPLVEAIWLLRDLDRPLIEPSLLKLSQASNPEVRGYALIGLEWFGGRTAARAFAERLNTDPDAWVREKAAHGLGFLFKNYAEQIGFRALLLALKDRSEEIEVRAQAAESLGNLLGCWHRHTRRYRKAERWLIYFLSDPAPEVRFWCAFALGTMQSDKALPRLKVLAEVDTAICPGWWAVKDEAKDAIEAIVTGSWPKSLRQTAPQAVDEPDREHCEHRDEAGIDQGHQNK